MTTKEEHVLSALIDASVAQIESLRTAFSELDDIAHSETGRELLRALAIASLSAQRLRCELETEATLEDEHYA